MPNSYTTHAKVREYMGLEESDTTDDNLFRTLMWRASKAIDSFTRRKFYPRVETRYYTLDDSKLVRLDDDLLSLTTLKDYNGASTVGAGVLFTAAGSNWNRTPSDRIIIDSSSGSTLNYSGTPEKAVEVTGVWGYHEDWDNAFLDTGTSLAASVTDSSTTLEVAGAGSTGSDINYEWPRIAIGDLVRLDSEYLQVVNTGGAAASVLVIRGANGTTAASHASAATVDKFVVEGTIEFAARRLAGWTAAQRNTPYEVGTSAPGQFGMIDIPQSWPPDVKERLRRFVKREIQAL